MWDGRQEHPPCPAWGLCVIFGVPWALCSLLPSSLRALPSSPAFIPALPTSEPCAEPRPWRCGAARGRRQQRGAASPAGPRAPSPQPCAADALPPSPAARGKAVVCMFAGAEGVGRGESALSALADGEGAGGQVGWRLWTLRARPVARPRRFLPDSSEQLGAGKGHAAGHCAAPSCDEGLLPASPGWGGHGRASRCLPPCSQALLALQAAGGDGQSAVR